MLNRSLESSRRDDVASASDRTPAASGRACTARGCCDVLWCALFSGRSATGALLRYFRSPGRQAGSAQGRPNLICVRCFLSNLISIYQPLMSQQQDHPPQKITPTTTTTTSARTPTASAAAAVQCPQALARERGRESARRTGHAGARGSSHLMMMTMVMVMLRGRIVHE